MPAPLSTRAPPNKLAAGSGLLSELQLSPRTECAYQPLQTSPYPNKPTFTVPNSHFSLPLSTTIRLLRPALVTPPQRILIPRNERPRRLPERLQSHRPIQLPLSGLKSTRDSHHENYDPRSMKEAIAPIQNKVGALLQSPMLRNILGQIRNRVSIPFTMDNRRSLHHQPLQRPRGTRQVQSVRLDSSPHTPRPSPHQSSPTKPAAGHRKRGVPPHLTLPTRPKVEAASRRLSPHTPPSRRDDR
jgi:hypothetical protein